jgi:frataxin-like iron-binding protein CyaY
LNQSEPIMQVWIAIQHKGLRFIGVVDDQDKIVGLTGQKGISEYIAEHCPQQVMVQRIGGKPGLQQREGA